MTEIACRKVALNAPHSSENYMHYNRKCGLCL